MNNCATCGSPEMLLEAVPFRYGMDICAIRCAICYNFVCAPRSWKEDPFYDAKALWNAQADKAAAPTQVETQWQPIDTSPPEDTPVWLQQDDRIWIGTHTYEGDGWVFTNCYGSQFWDGSKWDCTDAEFDDDYKPTHWMPLPATPSTPPMEHNFCPDCGKRNAPGLIHTCTPPVEQK